MDEPAGDVSGCTGALQKFGFYAHDMQGGGQIFINSVAVIQHQDTSAIAAQSLKAVNGLGQGR